MFNKLVIANWKMHGRRDTAAELVGALVKVLPSGGVDIALAPPFPYLSQVATLLEGASLQLAAQDVSRFKSDGAYTGEVSVGMLKDVGCQYVLIGHSERRHYQAESPELLAAKLDAVWSEGLVPVLCVGETLEQRDAQMHEAVIASQLSVVRESKRKSFVIAYEPVWAIGTGKVATLEQIDGMHQFIAQTLLQYEIPSDSIRVLYGGSVKPENAREILGLASVSGALVGGASLNVDSFQQICWSAKKTV